MTATGADLERRCQLNQMDYFEWMTRTAPGGTLYASDDELAYRLPHDFPLMSGLMRAHERPDAERLVERTLELFGDHGGGFMAFLRPGEEDLDLERALAAVASGDQSRYPQMVCPEPLPVPELPGVEIRPVEDVAAGADYWAICNAAYPSLGVPGDVFDLFTPESLLDDRVRAFVAYMDGEPVSCSTTYTSRGIGGLYWVATVEPVRGRGIGAAITVASTNAGFEDGAELAALQASPMGEPVYERLGYRELFSFRLQYAVAPAAD